LIPFKPWFAIIGAPGQTVPCIRSNTGKPERRVGIVKLAKLFHVEPSFELNAYAVLREPMKSVESTAIWKTAWDLIGLLRDVRMN
jgi:hypothetical protein